MHDSEAAARIADVATADLSAWHREGLPVMHHDAAGQPAYDDADIERIREIRRLVRHGWAPQKAVELVLDVDGKEAPVEELMGPRRRRTSALALAARSMYPAIAEAALNEAFSTRSFEEAIDWLMAELTDLGEAWEAGLVDVAGEHLVSGIVQRRLAAEYAAASLGAAGPLLVCGLPQGCHHGMLLLAFVIAARRAGFDVLDLGADVPHESWLAAVRRRRPVEVVTSVVREDDIASVRGLLAALSAEVNGPTVYAGGGFADQVGDPLVVLPDRIGEAARMVTARHLELESA